MSSFRFVIWKAKASSLTKTCRDCILSYLLAQESLKKFLLHWMLMAVAHLPQRSSPQDSMALNNEMMKQSEGETAHPLKWKEIMNDDEDEEFQFSNLMDRLEAKNVLDDENDVKQLWLQLRKDEPHLLSNFEEFLVRIFSQLQEADNEKNELECALKKKTAAYDEEIQHLYEEMERQVKKEKEQSLLKDTERFQSYSQELECKLLSKEQELEQLVQNQEGLEQQRTELLSRKEETKVENTKLKLTNEELLRDLERTSHKLSLAQQQLQVLQVEASRLHEEKEMEVYRVTETLEREKSGLLKQLDFLRERNKHLRDEHDIFLQKCKVSVPEASWKQRSWSVIGKYIEGKMLPNSHSFEEDDIFCNSKRSDSAGLNGILSVESDAGATGRMSKALHLQRIISIEEDHLPQLLDRLVDKQLNRWTGEDENTSSEMEMDEKNTEQSMERSPSSSREQPVGKETLSNVRGQGGPHFSLQTSQTGDATGFTEQLEIKVCSYLKEERINSVPDRLFKIIFVGNSGVGKTSFLRRFCEDHFFPGTATTVGVDYNVKTITVDNTQVTLQLWDTAGQERYRSITKQFFRKADGVIVMYDITAKDTFATVKQWLISIEETTGENVPVLLLGNKTDNEKEREVPMVMGEHLAKDYNLIFYECSAYSGYNTKKSVLHLARILKEHEDKVKEKTIELQSDTNKKSCCISP
ncbi:EF-hand calcium-binding domain-containing protein 4B isoform X2 [Tyto alba]|uniref:EF-hand calcium-binding domain-containing protein 4B isoform X2 n=1 Tax=Tyto alba TaxID=56313 RepID=UPI001403E942|nr:EF-hand calcium-binding domain-containing protein 4B isoform X2 [Tyto alba]